MAIRIFGTNSIRADLGKTDSVFVAGGVTVGRTDGGAFFSDYAIVGTGGGHKVEIHGNVVSTECAVSLGNSGLIIEPDSTLRGHRLMHPRKSNKRLYGLPPRPDGASGKSQRLPSCSCGKYTCKNR